MVASEIFQVACGLQMNFFELHVGVTEILSNFDSCRWAKIEIFLVTTRLQLEFFQLRLSYN
jgi:hypothetical protein